MGTRRQPYVMDQLGGENNFDSLTNQSIFGSSARQPRFRRLRNYHLIGYGRALKRRGYKTYVATKPNGNNPIQGLVMDEWGSTRDLYAVVGGQLRRLNGTSWDNVTGTVTLATGQDAHIRFTNFTDGNSNWLLGCDGTNEPFAVKNGASADKISTVAGQPIPWNNADNMPVDMVEFHGHLLALNKYSLYITAYGTLDFQTGDIIETQRRSLGVGLALHSRDIALVFFERGVYALQFAPFEGVTFRSIPIEGAEGCVSKDSIITKDGYTYYGSHRGIYRIGNPERGAKRISEEIQDYWDSLNQARRFQIRRVERGSPWYEVMWLVSTGGSSEHDSVIVWNDRLEQMTIFPASASGVSGTGHFNAGCLYRGADLIDRTIVGGYDGFIYEAWGNANSDSGTSDNGVNIATELETGFVNFGFPGVSDLRELIIDGEASSNVTFNVQGETLGSAQVVNAEATLGTTGKVLGEFFLSVDYLVASTVTQTSVDLRMSGRGHKVRLTESSQAPPYIITALTFAHMLKRLRLR